MKQPLLLRPKQWRTRVALSAVLLTIGIALLGAARNDHWSATVGLAFGQLAIAAGAWSVARPLLSTALVALGQQQWQTLRPSLVLLIYTCGLMVLSGAFTPERAFTAVYLTLPGLLLDTLLRWRERQEAAAPHPSPTQQEHPHDHDCP